MIAAHRTDVVELHRWSKPVEYGATAEDQVLVAAELGAEADAWMASAGLVVPKSVRNAKDPGRPKHDGYEPLLVEVYIQVPLGKATGTDCMSWTPRGRSWFEMYSVNDTLVEQVRDAIAYGGDDPDCDIDRGQMYVPIEDIRRALEVRD